MITNEEIVDSINNRRDQRAEKQREADKTLLGNPDITDEQLAELTKRYIIPPSTSVELPKTLAEKPTRWTYDNLIANPISKVYSTIDRTLTSDTAATMKTLRHALLYLTLAGGVAVAGEVARPGTVGELIRDTPRDVVIGLERALGQVLYPSNIYSPNSYSSPRSGISATPNGGIGTSVSSPPGQSISPPQSGASPTTGDTINDLASNLAGYLTAFAQRMRGK